MAGEVLVCRPHAAVQAAVCAPHFLGGGGHSRMVARQKGVQRISHYINDFILVRALASDERATHLHSFLSTCDELGVLVAQDKTESPAT